jgi:prepilin-type N-terminal cleavage/methylation domain-containing protein
MGLNISTLKKRKGFTLIEMMITLSILSILLVLLSYVIKYSFQNFREENRNLSYRNDVKSTVEYIIEEVSNAKDMYMGNKGGLLLLKDNIIYITTSLGYRNIYPIVDLNKKLNNTNLKSELWYYYNEGLNRYELRDKENNTLSRNLLALEVVENKENYLKLSVEVGRMGDEVYQYNVIVEK